MVPPAGNFGNAAEVPPNGLLALFAPPAGGNKDEAPPPPPPPGAPNGLLAPVPNAVGFGKLPKIDVFGSPSSSESSELVFSPSSSLSCSFSSSNTSLKSL
jgi:hypothetical protein